MLSPDESTISSFEASLPCSNEIVVQLRHHNHAGGENIYPREIEERLCCHSSISDAAVVGLKNDRYGEVPAAFVKHRQGGGDAGLGWWGVRAT